MRLLPFDGELLGTKHVAKLHATETPQSPNAAVQNQSNRAEPNRPVKARKEEPHQVKSNKCPFCTVRLPPDRLDSHIRVLHPTEIQDRANMHDGRTLVFLPSAKSDPTLADENAEGRQKLDRCPECDADLPHSQLAEHLRNRHAVGLGMADVSKFKWIWCPRCCKLIKSSDLLSHAIKMHDPWRAESDHALALGLKRVKIKAVAIAQDKKVVRSRKRSLQQRFERNLIQGGLASGR